MQVCTIKANYIKQGVRVCVADKARKRKKKNAPYVMIQIRKKSFIIFLIPLIVDSKKKVVFCNHNLHCPSACLAWNIGMRLIGEAEPELAWSNST